jgi:serine/threonine-protein kinase HipA
MQSWAEGKAPEGHDRVEGVEVDDAATASHLLEVVTPDRYGTVRRGARS